MVVLTQSNLQLSNPSLRKNLTCDPNICTESKLSNAKVLLTANTNIGSKILTKTNPLKATLDYPIGRSYTLNHRLSGGLSSNLPGKFSVKNSTVLSSGDSGLKHQLENPLLSSSKAAPGLAGIENSSNKLKSNLNSNLKPELKCFQCRSALETRLKTRALETRVGIEVVTHSSLVSGNLQGSNLSDGKTTTQNLPTSVLSHEKLIEKPRVSFGGPKDAPVLVDLDDFSSDAVQIDEERRFQFEKPIFPPLNESRDADESPIQALDKIKKTLINTISGALIAAPNFTNPADEAVINITQQLNKIARSQDPEFILKLALYSRQQLNLRTVSNFLLAYSSYEPACRPYLKRYFKKSIVLPTDWIEVAELYQNYVSSPKASKHGMVSAALRKALIEKFPDFDEYQLGKYNKQKRAKKVTTKKVKGKVVKIVQTSNNGQKKKFTLKQLIRMTHITKPVNHVMSILGKKYPDSPEEFNKLQMTGVFDSEKAGKRMRLATPETWETQVSARGNKAAVWEELLDHNKLPFMAMLRNLRNLIKAGISEQHHKKVVRKLMDEKTIIRSRQFPFRFFSAFVALDDLVQELEKAEKEQDAPPAPKKPVIKKKVSKSHKKKTYVTKKPKPLLYNRTQIAAYKKALGKSVKIATMYNVSPIPNKTWIFCNTSDIMYKPCTSARAFGKPKEMIEVGVLLGLMCQHACESSSFNIFHENGLEHIPLSKDNILERTQRILKLAATASGKALNDDASTAVSVPQREEAKFPEELLWDLIKKNQKIDNLVILTRDISQEKTQENVINSFLVKYRRLVNPNLLFVKVDLSGASTKMKLGSSESPLDSNYGDGNEDVLFEHPNDICIAGFSEQLLQFIAERGNNAQLQHVSAIDKAYELHKIKVHIQDLPTEGSEIGESTSTELSSRVQIANVPKIIGFRKVRIFISSTFKDMQMERSLIVESLMQELRKKLSHRLHLILEEIDLRWGVVNSENSSSLAVCLDHVQKCHIFVGLVGNRLGFCPMHYDVPLLQQFDWLRNEPVGKSITELEFLQARQLNKPMVVLMRDSDGDDSISALDAEVKKQYEFRDRVLNMHNELVELRSYVERDEKSFGMYFIKALSDLIESEYSTSIEYEQKDSHAKSNEEQKLVLEHKRLNAVGRNQLVKDAKRAIKKLAASGNQRNTALATSEDEKTWEPRGAVLLIKGEAGIGKTTFMASLIKEFEGTGGDETCSVETGLFYHFVGGAESVESILTRLLKNFKIDFHLDDMEVPLSSNELRKEFLKWLQIVVSLFSLKRQKRPFLLFFDGLERMCSKTTKSGGVTYCNLNWVPKVLPKGCVFVLSVSSSGPLHKRAEELADDVISIGELNVVDRKHLVQSRLSNFGKHLDTAAFNNQLGQLVSKRDASNPLYLTYACDELRMSGTYEQLNARIKALPQTVNALLESFIKTMEAKFGSYFTAAALLLLHLSPAGAHTKDLWHILSVYRMADFDLSSKSVADLHELFAKRVSSISYLWFSKLATYLKLLLGTFGSEQTESDESRVDWMQIDTTMLSDVIEKKYLSKMDKLPKRVMFNKILAAFHLFRASNGKSVEENEEERGDIWTMPEGSCYSLILHHLQSCGDWKLLKSLVVDLNFVKVCFETDSHHKLVQCLNSTEDSAALTRPMAKEADAFLKDPSVVAVRNFVASNLHIFTRVPHLVYQQASFSRELQARGEVDVRCFEAPSLDCSFYSFEWINKPLSGSDRVFSVKDFSVPIVSLDVLEGTNTLAVGVKDCRVLIYDTETAKMTNELSGFMSPVSVVKFVSRDKMVVGTDGGQLLMYSVNDWHKLSSWKKHERKVVSVACDPAGMTFATVGWDCTLMLWNVSDGKLESEVERASPCAINSVDWHPNRPLLAIACWDSTIKLLNTTSKTMEYSYRGHSDSVRSVVFTRPDGSRLISSSLDGQLRLWSVTEKCLLCIMDYIPNVTITQLRIVRGGQMLVGTGSDGQLRVWRSDLGKEITALDVRQQTLTEDNPSNAVVSKSSRREDTQDVSVKSVAFCKNQTLFAVLLADGNISVACGSTYKILKSTRFPQDFKAILQFIEWIDNSLLIVSERRLFIAYCYPKTASRPISTWPFNSDVEFTVEKIGVATEKTKKKSSSSGVQYDFYSSEKQTCLGVGIVPVKEKIFWVVSVGSEYGNVDLFKVESSQISSRDASDHFAPVHLERLFTVQSAHEGPLTHLAFVDRTLFSAAKDRVSANFKRLGGAGKPPEIDNSTLGGQMLVGTGSDGQLRVWRSDLGKEITALDVRQQTLTEDNPSNAIVSKSSRREDTQDVSVKSVAFCKNQTLFAVLLADGNISVACGSTYKILKSTRFPQDFKAILQFIEWIDNSLLVVSERRLFIAYCYPKTASRPISTWHFNSDVKFTVEKIGVATEKTKKKSSFSGVQYDFYSSEKQTCLGVGIVPVKEKIFWVVSVGSEYGNVDLFKVESSQISSRDASDHFAPVHLERLFTVQSAHEGPLTHLAFVDRTLFSAAKDRKVALWDMKKIKNGKGPVQVIQNAHEDWVTCLDASEEVVVTGSADNSIRVWKRINHLVMKEGDKKGKEERAVIDANCAAYTLTGHNSAIQYVKYFNDADLIVSSDSEGVVKCWRYSTGSILASNQFTSPASASISTLVCEARIKAEADEDSPVMNLEIADWAAEVEKDEEISAQSKREIPTKKEESKKEVHLVIGHEDGHTTVVDPMVGDQTSSLVGHSEVVNCVCEQSKDSSVFSGASDSNVIKWDLKVQSDSAKSVNKCCDVTISAIDFYVVSSLARVVVGDVAGELQVVEHSSGRRLTMNHSVHPKHHKGFVSGVNVAVHAKRVFVMSAGRDGKVHNWEITEANNGAYGSIASLSLLSTTDLGSPVANIRKVSSLIDKKNPILFCCWDGSLTALARSVSRPENVMNLWSTASPSLKDEPWRTDWLVVKGPNKTFWNLHCSMDERDCFVSSSNALFQTPDRRAGYRIETCHEFSSSQWTCFEVDAREQGLFYIGDANGFVHMICPKEYEKRNSSVWKVEQTMATKAHEGAVRCISLAHALLVTAGDDCEIRVWRKEEVDKDGTKERRLIQVGQFSCSGPVSCLTVSRNEDTRVKLSNISAADKLGNVYSLKIYL